MRESYRLHIRTLQTLYMNYARIVSGIVNRSNGCHADQIRCILTVLRGEFKSEDEDQTKYLLSELPCGCFSRVITLPTAADAEHVEATIKNGVLSLRIPKAEADRPKAIKVTTN